MESFCWVTFRPARWPAQAWISQVYHNLSQLQIHFAEDLVTLQCLVLQCTGLNNAPFTRVVFVQSCVCKQTGHLSQISAELGAAGRSEPFTTNLSATLALSKAEKRLHLDNQKSGMAPRRLNLLAASSSCRAVVPVSVWDASQIGCLCRQWGGDR